MVRLWKIVCKFAVIEACGKFPVLDNFFLVQE